MKALIVGDANCATGFARCTHALADSLHSAGHSVSVLGLNYFGDPHPHPYPIYPCFCPPDNGRDYFGLGRLPRLLTRIKPDILVLLTDPWNVPGYITAADQSDYFKSKLPPVIGWLAVDGGNQRKSDLEKLYHVVVWTDFAKKELESAGASLPITVIPLGVDTSLFYPRDRSVSRGLLLTPDLNLNPDSFIVGVVCRNHTRKRLDLTLRYFSSWINQYSVQDAVLYLHVAAGGDGCDLWSLISYYGLSGKAVVARPDMMHGSADKTMPFLYSAFDLFLSTSQGEGFCLPAIEAMACGVPCVLPDNSGFSSWVGGSESESPAAAMIPCYQETVIAPLDGLPYVIGKIPDEEATVDTLQVLYQDADLRQSLSARGLELANRPEHQWSNIGQSLTSLLESIAHGD